MADSLLCNHLIIFDVLNICGRFKVLWETLVNEQSLNDDLFSVNGIPEKSLLG